MGGHSARFGWPEVFIIQMTAAIAMVPRSGALLDCWPRWLLRYGSTQCGCSGPYRRDAPKLTSAKPNVSQGPFSPAHSSLERLTAPNMCVLAHSSNGAVRGKALQAWLPRCTLLRCGSIAAAMPPKDSKTLPRSQQNPPCQSPNFMLQATVRLALLVQKSTDPASAPPL